MKLISELKLVSLCYCLNRWIEISSHKPQKSVIEAVQYGLFSANNEKQVSPIYNCQNDKNA